MTGLHRQVMRLLRIKAEQQRTEKGGVEIHGWRGG
jgi:hypothetical protein